MQPTAVATYRLVLRPGAAHGQLPCQYGRANRGTQYPPVWRGELAVRSIQAHMPRLEPGRDFRPDVLDLLSRFFKISALVQR